MNDYAVVPYRRDFRVEAEEEEDDLTPAFVERPELPHDVVSTTNDDIEPRRVSGTRAAVSHDESPEPWEHSSRLSDTLLPPPSDISKRTILVVGLDLVPSLSGALRASGFVLSVASTVESAKRLSNERIPAAILFGPSLGPEPYRFLHWIRDQRRQVFVFASDDGSSSARDAIVAGADEVLVCGESSDEIEQVVDRIAARVVRSQSLSELSLLDPLTELHNRRFMNERLPAEIARAARSRSVLSLAILDIDHFKSINDEHGHIAGDRALVAFSWLLRSNLRLYDTICRYGGDEFVILFPDCTRARARDALAQLNAHTACLFSDLPTITFSAGVAEFPRDGASWPELLEAADVRVRAAKKRGASHVVSEPL